MFGSRTVVTRPLLALCILGGFLGACLDVPELSREGVVTDLALEKKAPVYAPRTARAQKVVFDDATKELIHAPDTPLRRFFDERARDFNPADLDYAKTTILMDVVEMLRGREYLSRVVRGIVDRHVGTALQPAPSEEVWSARLAELAQELRATGAQPEPKGEELDAAKEALLTLLGQAQQILDAARIETEVMLTDAQAKRMLQDGFDRVPPEVRIDLARPWRSIADAARRLGATLGDIHRAITTARRLQGLATGTTPPSDGAGSAAARERNARLLASSVELELLRANYPDIRDEEVDRVIGEFTDGGKGKSVWLQTTRALDPLARSAVDALALDLRETLKSRDFLQRVIDDAVIKRKGLFRTGEVSLAGHQKARSTFNTFIRTNLGTALAAKLLDKNASLWSVWLEEQGQSRLVKDDKPLVGEDLAAFGRPLRAAILEALAQGAGLEKAMFDVLGESPHLERVKPRDASGGLSNEAKEVFGEMGKDALLEEAFDGTVEASKAAETAKGAFDDAKKKTKKAEDSVATEREVLDPLVLKAKAANEGVKQALGPLTSEFDDYWSDPTGKTAGELEADIQSHSEPAPDELAKALAIVYRYAEKRGFAPAGSDAAKAWTAVEKARQAVRTDIAGHVAAVTPRAANLKLLDGAYYEQLLASHDSIVASLGNLPEDGDAKKLAEAWVGALKSVASHVEKILIDKRAAGDAVPDGAIALANELATDLTGFAALAKPDYASLAEHAEPFGALKNKLSGWKAAIEGLVTARRAEKTEESASEKAQNALAAALGTVTGTNDDSLAGRLLRAARIANDKAEAELKLDTRDLAAHLLAHITMALEGDEDDYGELAMHVEAGLLKFSVELDRLPARKRIAERFAQVFDGHPSLAGADDPILVALLKSPAIPFARDENRARAATTFPALFSPKKKPGEKGFLDDLVEAAHRALDTPQMSSLFGLGAVNDDLAHAFSVELFRAFKYRIQAAVDAEREADYEYWWLTFYPKAVPLGGRSFEGESLLEVSLGESLVPEEQYHRWLTDQGRVLSAPRTGDAAAEDFEDVRVRAVTILTNFLAVLDASPMVGEYPNAREAALQGLTELTRGRTPFEAYRDAVQALHAAALAELTALGVQDGVSSPALEYVVAVAETLISEPPGDLVGVQQETGDLENRARTELAWRDFGILHLAFALARTGASRTLLPTQVDLYLSAYFSGVARFTETPTKSDLETAWVFLEQTQFDELQARAMNPYVVPFGGWDEIKRLRTYLALRGVDSCSLEQMAERLDLIREAARTTAALKIPAGARVGSRAAEELQSLVDDLRGREAALDVSTILREYAKRSPDRRQLLLYFFAEGIKYDLGVTPSRYLAYPQLWIWEMRLDDLRASLREETSNLFHSAYPAVPDRDRMRIEFSRDDARLELLVYQWIRELWVASEDRGYFALAEESSTARGGSVQDNEKSVRVLLGLFLDRYPFLSREAVRALRDELPGTSSIYDWVERITANQALMDQLSDHLLDSLYEPLYDALWRLSQTERHPVDLRALGRRDYLGFLDWARPELQAGIQIVDLLPGSRDDLVSTSIHEGGVVAELAGKAEASATYDANQLELFQRALQQVDRSLDSSSAGGRSDSPIDLDDPNAGLERVEGLAESEDVLRSERLRREGELQGWSASASGRGSVFGRARSALAFARRREYLDATITAAGRGDSAARWVIRKGDTRSNLTSGDRRNNLQAAHTGQPNGDQPFHLLVKVPQDAIQTDWQGDRYILFNSSYSAVARRDTGRDIGSARFLLKPLVWLLHQEAWQNVESNVVASVFPFRWDVKKPGELEDLIRTPNLLGGRIELDDTDKIRHSEILKLIEAESTFVRTTRSLQLAEVESVLGGLDERSDALREEVQTALTQRLQQQRELRDAQLEETGLEEVRTELGQRLDEIEERIDELEEEEGAEDEGAGS